VKYILQILIGIAVLGLLFINVFKDFSALKAVKIDFIYFFFGIVAYTGLNLVLSYRIEFLLGKMQGNVGFKKAFISHLGGMIVGDVTPGRSGYLATSKFLSNFGCGIERGLAAIVTPQGIEFLLKALSAALAIAYISSKLPAKSLIFFTSGIFVVVIGALVILGFLWTEEQKSKRLVEKIPYLARHAWRIVAFKEYSKQIKPYILHIIALYAIGWVFTAFQWYFVGKAVGLALSFTDYFFLHPLITALMFVPVTPAGLGIMESASVLTLYLLGVEPSLAFVFTILARLNNIFADLPGLYPVMKFK
jgi:hypothetical protein